MMMGIQLMKVLRVEKYNPNLKAKNPLANLDAMWPKIMSVNLSENFNHLKLKGSGKSLLRKKYSKTGWTQ